MEQQSARMLDLSQRILPPNFLLESPKEAGFCLTLLHPESLSRPTTRKQKQKHASKLIEGIRFLGEDIKEAERSHLLRTFSIFPPTQNEFPDAGKKWLHFEEPGTSVAHYISNLKPDVNDGWLSKNIRQLERAYFSMRSQIHSSKTAIAACSDKDLLKNRDSLTELQSENGELRKHQKSIDPLGSFFEGLCKLACYSKFEVCGTIRNADLLNSANVICTLSFDSNEDYIATAGILKRIKIFEFAAFMNDSIDIHYPVVEMLNKSKLSCVCWNNYIKNYLASTDYDGVVQTWDVETGQGFCQYTEHQKRAWSVDFSQADPTKFASGSDDCSVKLWSINEKSSLGTIRSPVNVCCVQFSIFYPHLLAFGSADYKNFVGLSVLDGYIACGSETNEVYCYYRSLPMPITSYKFRSVDHTSGHRITDENGQFVSSVCWRQRFISTAPCGQVDTRGGLKFDGNMHEEWHQELSWGEIVLEQKRCWGYLGRGCNRRIPIHALL
ncbi:hypothetical protein CRYUN_Cryun20dG0033700 [Craigia yunnanensis]